MGKHVRSIVIVVFIFIAVIFLVDKLVLNQPPVAKLAYSDFYAAVEDGNVKSVTISNHDIAGQLNHAIPSIGGTDPRFTTSAPDDPTLVPDLLKHKVEITNDNPQTTPFIGMLVQLVPFALMALLLLFILRQAQSGGSQALSFGRSRAKLLSENRPKV
ncbi:MAG: ATP-dependent metallopeptidase FtsH/Yme1/Tma family protein, partial [Candidatus Eremiobacteraeota bacterium]|nr:ATP-dependent metallopeptidase FtsH/Yme1/Tma family protein [Candidatus Eremiobacteraeota bacterium]